MELIVTLSCADRPGIVNALTGTIFNSGGNIIENQQFTDPLTNTFVMRTGFEITKNIEEVKLEISKCLAQFNADFQIRENTKKKRALVLVTKEAHCLHDLLYLEEIGELDIDIVAVASNREDLSNETEGHDTNFYFLPINDENSKLNSEIKMREIIESEKIDFIILARYMQILSSEFCKEFSGRIINIHHSFLPGFKGAKPYHQAYERGVKLIGATAHFVTSDLDEGPIIEQDVENVTHSCLPEELVAIGRDIERRVLSRAVQNYAQDRIFIVGNRTVVFKK